MAGIVSVLSETICELGEGPSYDPATGSLFWFNIVHGQLLERGRSGVTKVHELGQMASVTLPPANSPCTRRSRPTMPAPVPTTRGCIRAGRSGWAR